MLRLALSQLRDQPRRYLSVLLAITIGITFLASALLVGSSATASLRNSLGATYSTSDLVIAPSPDAEFEVYNQLAEAAGTSEEPGPLQEVAGVDYAYPHVTSSVGLLRPDGLEGDGTWSTHSDYAMVTTTPQDTTLIPEPLLAGDYPTPGSTTEITVDQRTAEEFGLSVGSSTRLVTSAEDGDEGQQVTVVGLTARSQDLMGVAAIQIRGTEQLADSLRSGAAAAANAAAAAARDAASEANRAATAGAQHPEAAEARKAAEEKAEAAEEQAEASTDLVTMLNTTHATHVLVRLDDGADPDRVAAALQAFLAAEGVSATVATPEVQAQEQVALVAGSDILLWVLAAFAAIALLVTALVIANTFSVLVAQRSRDLALLRVLGAYRRQVRAVVLTEAALVGLAGALLGVAAAYGLINLLVSWGASGDGFGFLTFEADPVDLALSVAVGIVLTVVASMAAAARGTRVSPLSALRPKAEASVGNRAGWLRLVLGLLLLAAGAAALLWGAAEADLAVAVAGGALSFVALMLLAILFVPALISVIGLTARPMGVPGRLARLNAVRNPARTAATTAALLIGTTLVSMMLTGGRTAQVQMDTLLSAEYPIDVRVVLDTSGSGVHQPAPPGSAGWDTGTDGGPGSDAGAEDDAGPAGERPGATAGEASGIMDGDAAARARDAVADADGIEAAALVMPAGRTDDGSVVYAADPADLTSIVGRLPVGESADRLGEAGTVLVPTDVTAQTLVIEGPEDSREFEVIRSSSSTIDPVIPLADAEALGLDTSEPTTTAPQLWLSATDDQSLEGLQDLNTEVAQAAGVSQDRLGGTLAERLMFALVIDALLILVTALLAVSVLIALIGVANTLSLSTIERTRENALMRALGLTRNGLRGMLALEAVLISGVAALIGCTLGTVYGGLGAHTVFAPMAAGIGQTIVWPTIPWPELALIIGVSIAAGLLASVTPAQRATRLSPVQGLATA